MSQPPSATPPMQTPTLQPQGMEWRRLPFAHRRLYTAPGQRDINAAPLTHCSRLLDAKQAAEPGTGFALHAAVVSQCLLDKFLNLVLSYQSITSSCGVCLGQYLRTELVGKKKFCPRNPAEIKWLYICAYVCV